MKDVFLNALSQDGTINEIAISTESLGRLFGPLQKQVGYDAASGRCFYDSEIQSLMKYQSNIVMVTCGS